MKIQLPPPYDGLAERYELLRLYCLRWANLSPEDSFACHIALSYCQRQPEAMHFAALLDDMMLALKQAVPPSTPKQGEGE